MNEAVTKIKLTKLDVARRQLDAAIELWFNDYDPISVHTLACATHEIFSDICKHSGLAPLLFAPSLYRDGMVAVARSWLHKHYNFFKHANKDPEGFTEFPPVISELFIYMSIEGWRSLGGERRELDDAFIFHLLMRHPEFHRTDTPEHIDQLLAITDAAKIVGTDNRGEFLRLYRLAKRGQVNPV